MPADDEEIPSDTTTARIGRQVMRTLGTPTNLFKVKVHPVGGDRYRVNVLVGPDYASARITDSFFLTADAKGNITSSSPEIVRHY